MTAIEPLQASALERAVVTAASAYVPDPMITWVFPDAARRPAASRALMRVLVGYGLRYGRVTASHDARAVCVWIPPGSGITISSIDGPRSRIKATRRLGRRPSRAADVDEP